VHSSRSKGALETLARVVGLPPRRCAACGWRGLRPRAFYDIRRCSKPELAKVEAPTAPAPQLPPVAPAPVAPADPNPHHHHHRHHRHRTTAKRKRSATFSAIALAVALGVCAGFMVYSCGGQ
jgi:hypothetical protein